MAGRHRHTEQSDEWLREHYGKGVPLSELMPEFEAEFGWRPTEQALYCRVCRIGVNKKVFYGREAPLHAVRSVRWQSEPEMQAWMEANDDGRHTVWEVSRGFEQKFGFPLSGSQVTHWRIVNERTVRRQPKESIYAIGDEVVKRGMNGKKDYTVVKVAAEPKRRGSKDNWKLKHVLVWEKHHGTNLPPDTVVMFGDGNTENFDPDNLVAVPRSVVGMLNLPESPEWHDADGLKTAMSLCMLRSAVKKAEFSLPRKCGVCGKEFHVPDGHETNIRTCPDCLAKGRKSKGTGKPSSGPLVGQCAVCGREFAKRSKSQVRCEACIRAKPKHWAVRQRETRERLMRK